MPLIARIAMPLVAVLMALISVGVSADWKYDYRYGSESEISRINTVYSSRIIAGAADSVPVGFLRYQGALTESSSDINTLRIPGNLSGAAFLLTLEHDAVALDALGDYMYFQVKDPVTGIHSLERCTLVGCSLLKNNAGDPRAVQMGLPSHTLNPQGVIFTWYQNQATSPRINQLSFFDTANTEHEVLQGDGYVTAISRPINPAKGINAIASMGGKPILAQLKNSQAHWWPLKTLSASELVPIAIDGNENPRVILLEKNEDYAGSIFSCDIDWTLNSDKELNCVGGLVELGLKADFNLGWYLDDNGLLYANQVLINSSLDSDGALINTNNSQFMSFRSLGVGSSIRGKFHYFYTTIYGDLIYRLNSYNGFKYVVTEVDKNGDRLGDAWTDAYPTTLNRADQDEDSDGLSNFQEYLRGTNPLNKDTDGDTLTDLQEVEYGTNPRSGDSDGDQIADAVEIANGTNPNKKDSDGDGYLDNNDDYPLDPDQYEDFNSDIDGDGIPDYFEDKTSGISTSVADSHKDADDDGLTNLQEYNLTTDINNPDSDSDGLPDGYEYKHQFNPLSPEEGEMDADVDQDGWSNTLEYQAQTSPRNELEYPQKAMPRWILPEIERASGVSVAAQDGTVYVTTSTKIYSIALDSTINWTIPKPRVGTEYSLVIGEDGTIYLSDANEFKALNSDSSLKWSKPGLWRASIGEFGGVYLASSQENILTYVDSEGSEVWRTNTRVSSRPIVSFDQVYMLTSMGGVSAFSKQGELLWSFAGLSEYFAVDMYDQSIVVLAGSEIKRISSKGELLNSKTVNIPSYNQASLFIDDNKNIYVVGSNQVLYSFDASFQERWAKHTAGHQQHLLDSVGNIYVVSGGKVISYDSDGSQLWATDGIVASGIPVLSSDNTLQVGNSSFQIPLIENGNNYWKNNERRATNSGSVCVAIDLDCDGMPNDYEEQHGFDPQIPDGSLDLDRDGLSNFQEYILGSEPSFNDTDGDLIPDAYEVKYSLNLVFNDAAEDLDSDGYDNLTEYNEGTNPNDKFSTPEKVDGQLRWETSAILEDMTADDAGTIYGFDKNKVYAVDFRGEVKWEVESSPLRQPLALFSESKLLIVNEEGLRFINAETGETIISIDGYYTKVAKEQNGFIAAKAYPHSIIKYDLDANEIWHADVAYLIAQLAVNSNGVIYIGGVSNTVAAYSSMGDPLWKRNVGRYSISPFAIDSLGNLAFSDIDYLYSLTEMNEFNWPSLRGNSKLNLAPVIDGKDSVYFIQTTNNGYFLTEVDSAGQQENSYLLPERPGQMQLDGSGSVIVSFKKELRIYSNGMTKIINLREGNYQNSPVEVILLKNRLVASLKNQDNISPSLKNIYYANSMHTIGWSSSGGGTYNANSVCGLVDADCDGLSDSFELSIGLDPDLKDTLWDKDQDGIINIRELQLGLNPTSDDTDNDGIKDNFELLNGLDPLFDDADADADQDGYSNLVEYQAGSDINDASATALLETGVKQWEKTVSSRDFIVGPDSSSYVVEGDDVIAYNIKGLELWRNLAPNQYRNRPMGMMLANSEHLALLSQYQLVVYDVITGEQLWKVDGSFDTFAANGFGQIYLSGNQGLFLYDLSGDMVRQLDSNSTHSQLMVDKNGAYYFAPSRSVDAHDIQGNQIWTKNYSQTPQNLMLDPAGDIRFILSGELYRLDSNGNEKWRRKPSYPNSSNYRSVIGLSGISYLYGSNDYMVAIDDDGRELWNKSIGHSIGSDLSINKENSIKFLSNSKLISVNSKGIVSELALGIPYRPYSLTITDEQLFVSDGNKISKLYSDQKGLAFSWATKGAGNHNRKSLCGLIDDDCDGLPNSYEMEVGLNPQLHDTLNDIDGDGLSNIKELGIGSNMFARDTDSDGMPDKYEYTFGLDLLNHDAFEDADADGYTNFDEYSVKSDPNDPLSTALRENGVQQWSHSGQYKESAVDNDQNSYVVQDTNLIKFDAFGMKRWQTDITYSDIGMMPILVDGNSLLIVNKSRNSVRSYNVHTGRLLWSKNTNNPHAVVVDKQGDIYIRNSSIVEKISHNGLSIWSKNISGNNFLLNLNEEIVTTDRTNLYNYTLAGDSNWTFRSSENIDNVTFDLQGNYYLTHARSVSKISRTGQMLWTKQVGNSPSMVLTGFNGDFYLKSDDDVKRFNAEGSLIWSSRLASATTGDMTLGSDGKLYIPHYQAVSIVSNDGLVATISMSGQGTIYSVKPVEQSLFIASDRSYRRVFNFGTKVGSVWSSKLGGLHNKGSIVSHDDLDGDGLSDSYEQSVGLDHTRKDIFEDADQDGVNNLMELQLGLDPLDRDSDHDGMADGYEVKFGLDLKSNDANLDLDQDGFTNLQEFNAGSKANDALSLATLEIGTKRWSKSFAYSKFSIGESGKVLAWSGNILYGLDKYGEELWQLPVSYLNYDPIALPDDKAILLHGSYLSLIDTLSGTVVWSVSGGQYNEAILGKNRNIYALDRNRYLVSFDLNGNQVIPRTRQYDALVRQADGIIIGTEGRYIYQIGEDGVRVSDRIRGDDDFSPIALSLTSDIYASIDNYLYKFNSSGHELWNYQTMRHSSATKLYSPLVDRNGTSYTLFDNNLIAIDSSGSELWRKTVSDVRGAPVLASDGRVFIPGYQKVLVISENSPTDIVETIISLPDLTSQFILKIVGDKLIVAGKTKLESLYIGGDSASSSLQGWTSLKGGSHNGSLLCRLDDFDCVPSSSSSANPSH